MKLQIFTVDAFSDKPFGGNPAAIVPLTQDIDDDTMLRIASEMNISETTYIKPIEDTEGEDWTQVTRFSLRWFTPTTEVYICGHATLASAHAIFHCLGNKRDEIEFETREVGILKVKRDGDLLVMDFPSHYPEVPDGLPSLQKETFANLVEVCTGDLKSSVLEIRYNPIVQYMFVRLEDSVTEEELKNMSPNFSEMARIHDGSFVKAMGVSVAGDADGGVPFKYHAYSRFFATWIGVNEDPVCGSWHTVMGPYWAAELGVKDLVFRQCSKRGGNVKVSILGGGRVALAGPASTVISGHINI